MPHAHSVTDPRSRTSRGSILYKSACIRDCLENLASAGYFKAEAGSTPGDQAGALQLNISYIGQGRAHEFTDQDLTFWNNTLFS